jgi:hypothetical protein
MDSDERAEDVDYRRLVVRGVAHDALQSVERSQPDLDLFWAGLAELLDGSGEPVGDLPLLGQLLLLEAQLLLLRLSLLVRSRPPPTTMTDARLAIAVARCHLSGFESTWSAVVSST